MKADNKDKPEKIDVTPAKTEKTDIFDKKDKVEPQKKDDGPDKNQKSDKIQMKEEEKMKTINTDKDKANEKTEKVDKPEKTNKDEKKKEEETKVVEKGGKVTAKSPTNNNGKMSPESKSKVRLTHLRPLLNTNALSTNGWKSLQKKFGEPLTYWMREHPHVEYLIYCLTIFTSPSSICFTKLNCYRV